MALIGDADFISDAYLAQLGNQQATKEQVTYMTQRLLCLEKKPTPDDAADALAIAICSAHCSSAEKIRQGLNRL